MHELYLAITTMRASALALLCVPMLVVCVEGYQTGASFCHAARAGACGRAAPRRRSVPCLATVSSAARPDSKKIAVVGAGAVGLYYGARLLEAGHDVTFLARSELAVLQESGLTVESVDGNMRFESVKAVASAQDIGEVDWIVMALKSYALPTVRSARVCCACPAPGAGVCERERASR